MEITEEKQGSLVVLGPQGRLDSGSAPEFEEKIMSVVDGGDIRILVDFADLEYISSAGLRVLLMAAKKTQAQGGQVTLCALKPNIREVFEVSGFLAIFSVFDDRAAAIAEQT